MSLFATDAIIKTMHNCAQLRTMVDFIVLSIKLVFVVLGVSYSRQVTRATHVRNRVCPRVELILKIIIILLIIFLGFIKSKPC